jgi:hypothetical protein
MSDLTLFGIAAGSIAVTVAAIAILWLLEGQHALWADPILRAARRAAYGAWVPLPPRARR